MGWSLANFIRAYRIRVDCSPMPKSPFISDASGLFHHKCKLVMGGRENRFMMVPYSTKDPESIFISTEIDPKTREPKQVYKSRVSTREVLFTVACEAALYEISKRVIYDEAGTRLGVEHNRDIWTGVVFQTDTPPPPEPELERLYQNVRRQAYNLRVFLEGREAAETRAPTVYRTLISEVDEVRDFVYEWAVDVDKA